MERGGLRLARPPLFVSSLFLHRIRRRSGSLRVSDDAAPNPKSAPSDGSPARSAFGAMMVMALHFLTAKAGTTGRIGQRCRGYAAGRRQWWHRAGRCEDRHAGEKRKCRGRKKREGRLGPVVGIPLHIRRVLRPRARGEKVRDSNGRIRFSANADCVEFLNARFPPQHSAPLFRAGFRGCGAIEVLFVRFPPQHGPPLFRVGFRGCGAIEALSVRFPSQHSPPLFRAGFRGCGAIEVLSVRFPPQHGLL